MSWEYRVVRREVKKNEHILEIKEIYYDEDDNIYGYGDAPVPYGETKEDIRECLELMRRALNKPIIEYRPVKETKN